ncbi:MAG: AAA-like domain-containing protein [Oscillospiraceae bacterium]|nr:AAA-like domain-containing protein [Oscillospiraceae bacterium]
MKKFNVTGTCVPEEDYMVDISGKITQIKKLVDNRSYFTINRARQYGKTTTLNQLHKTLPDEYICAKISFEGLGDTPFESGENFCKSFVDSVCRALRFSSASKEYREKWVSGNVTNFDTLSEHITNMCEDKKVVLMIDEVDKTSNNRVFLNFLAILRDKFLERKVGRDFTFHSVILAGVYDVRNIKLKMINAGLYTPTESENKIYNSPWNIAVDFEVDMSFCPTEIATMLNDYETDHGTGMDIAEISEEIHNYTSGYPFLVSRICKHIDEKLGKNWTAEGVREAVKMLLAEKNTLFDDMFKNLENDKKLYSYVYDLLILGEYKPYMIYDPIVDMGVRYGFFAKVGNGSDRVAISNKVFELLMTDYYISKDLHDKKQITGVFHTDVIKNGRFDMELCLRKFAEHYAEIFNKADIEFLERHGRLLFVSYLKPLINGGGFYHMESAFTDSRRMDIVVNYGRDQFIVELKLWKGKQYELEAYEQLLGYMEGKKADIGYLLIFDFRKGKNKRRKTEWVESNGKRIFEVIV